MEHPNVTQNCRACQDKTREESRIHIFGSIKLPDIYKETTSLNIHENDGLPEILCLTCYNRLLEAYNFRKMCSAAALHFQRILSIDIPEEKYTPPEHLSDPFIALNPDMDDNELSSSSSENKYLPPDPILDILEEDPAAPEESEESEKLKNFNVECNLCDLIFFRKEDLEIHMMIRHQGLKACQCVICGRRFQYHSLLIKHLKKVHKRAIGEFLRQGPSYNVHSRTEEGPQNHMKSCNDPENPKSKECMCEKCGREFNNHSSLTKHTCSLESNLIEPLQSQLNDETKKKDCRCKFCPYENVSKSSMYRHVKEVHYGIRKYQCKVCDRSFGNSWNLKHHVMIHTGERPHACSECGKRFIQPAGLKTHMRRHQKSKFDY